MKPGNERREHKVSLVLGKTIWCSKKTKHHELDYRENLNVGWKV